MSESAEIVEQATPWGPVVVVSDPRVPLAWIRLAFPVGRYDALPADHDPDLLWRAAVNVALGDHGLSAEVNPWMTADACGVDALFLVADADAVANGLQALFEADYRGVYVPSRVLRSGWREARRSPEVVLARAVAETFYHRDDPRRTSRPSGALSGDQLRLVRDTVLSAPGPVFGVAGAVGPDAGAELVREVLAAADADPADPPGSALLPLIAADRRRPDVVLQAAADGEALLAWARPGVARDDASAPAAVLADEGLRAGIERLAREERGDTYAVRTSGMVDEAAGAWTLLATTAPERVPGLVTAVEEWLAAVARDGLPPADLARARARLEAAARAQTGAPYEVLADEISARLPGADRPELLAAARAVSVDEVQTFVRAFADPAERVRFRVLPADVRDPLAVAR